MLEHIVDIGSSAIKLYKTSCDGGMPTHLHTTSWNILSRSPQNAGSILEGILNELEGKGI
jgi:hypothetical protein